MTDQAHRPRRPEWTCVVDGENWPCATARRLMSEPHPDDPGKLALQMAQIMICAAEDLVPANPASLYKRFVAWTLPKGERCRVCQKRGHRFLLGIPPRMIPCPGAAR
jgi:hypothetical protein